jgi:hypothetical protein
MKKIAFTLVLNGMPFIKKQAEIIPQVFDEWYIIEGATLPVKDTAWCQNIDGKYYNNKKLSVDGTSEFLDSIASDKIKIVRKNDFWNGKVEMCNSIMHLVENAILMEFDVDEIWQPEVLKNVLEFCETNDGFDGLMFKCNYYVGPNLIIESENCYGDQNYEWYRCWKVKDKTFWLTHEHPQINGLTKFITKDFTKKKGWVFDHHAYVTDEQLKFKENFYNYKGAHEQWKKLQNCKEFPQKLKNFLPWVKDESIVNIKNKKLGIILAGKIGDIIICLPIAKYYHDKGYEIYWPIYGNLVDNFKEYIDYVNFIPLDMINFNPIEDSKKILSDLNCQIMDLSFTQPGCFNNENSYNFIYKNDLSFDEYRYKLANVPFEEKWNLKFIRNIEREDELYNKLVKGDYCLMHLDGSDGRANIKIQNEKDHQIIEVKPITKSIFDWFLVLSKAKVLVLYDSCVANFVEQVSLTNKKFFIKRSEKKCTPILKNKWIII